MGFVLLKRSKPLPRTEGPMTPYRRIDPNHA
jgi:hypothetical protein